MKPLLLALVLSGVLNEGSLDIGLDVLPEAFNFAAHRVGFTPMLRLSQCTQDECRWDVGFGVEMTARHRGDDITITRIEAKLQPAQRIAPEAMRQFENTCLTIVALIDREEDEAQQRSTAKTISASAGGEPSVHLDLPARNVEFYGARSSTTNQDGRDAGMRCGATAKS